MKQDNSYLYSVFGLIVFILTTLALSFYYKQNVILTGEWQYARSIGYAFMAEFSVCAAIGFAVTVVQIVISFFRIDKEEFINMVRFPFQVLIFVIIACAICLWFIGVLEHPEE